MVTLVSTSAMRVRMEGQLLVPLCLNCFMMRNVRFGWFLALSIGAEMPLLGEITKKIWYNRKKSITFAENFRLSTLINL